MNSTRATHIACLAALTLTIAGCAATGHRSGGQPIADVDISAIPDAVPENAPRSKKGNPDSYWVLGKRYYVLDSAAGFTQTGLASWYGRRFDGKPTSSGDPYDMYAMTAAHKRLPIPSWVRVTNLDNHRQVVVKINDRGPFRKGRIIDLSYVAARKLGIVANGTARVRLQSVSPEGSRQASARTFATTAGENVARTQETAAAPPAANTAAANSSVLLQVGAFSQAERAERAKNRAIRSGAHPVAVIPPAAGKPLYRVRVGPFDSSAALAAAKTRLADAGMTAMTIVR